MTQSQKLNDNIFNAVSAGNLGFLEYLHKNKVNLKIKDSDDNNILLIASMAGKVDIMKKAIYEFGIDINSQNRYGLDALKFAMLSGQTDAFLFLLEKGISPFLCDIAGNTSVHLAASVDSPILRNHKNYLETLFEYSKNFRKLVNAKNKFGNTPLHSVFASNKIDERHKIQNALTLIENGAVALENNDGKTPADACGDEFFANYLKTSTACATQRYTVKTPHKI